MSLSVGYGGEERNGGAWSAEESLFKLRALVLSLATFLVGVDQRGQYAAYRELYRAHMYEYKKWRYVTVYHFGRDKAYKREEETYASEDIGMFSSTQRRSSSYKNNKDKQNM